MGACQGDIKHTEEKYPAWAKEQWHIAAALMDAAKIYKIHLSKKHTARSEAVLCRGGTIALCLWNAKQINNAHKTQIKLKKFLLFAGVCYGDAVGVFFSL